MTAAPELVETLGTVVSDYEAGIPTNPKVRWVSLFPSKVQKNAGYRRRHQLLPFISYFFNSLSEIFF
jgi:hypothetical protein